MSRTKKKSNNSWIYNFLLTTVIVLVEVLKQYSFKINSLVIPISTFLVPFIYLIMNYITKKYGYRKGLTALITSTIIMSLFSILICIVLDKQLVILSFVASILGYIISGLVNITIYKFLLVNTTSPYTLVLSNYVFSSILFTLVSTLVNSNIIINDNYWASCCIVVLIQAVISIILTCVDKKVKVGLGKDD